jgi:hypothetical protein
MKQLLFSILMLSFIACNNETAKTEPYTKERATVKTDAVVTYTETENNNDTSKTLKVQLFEQKESLKYEVKFSYNIQLSQSRLYAQTRFKERPQSNELHCWFL